MSGKGHSVYKKHAKGYKKDTSLKYTVFRILDIDDLHRVARRREVYRMQSCHGEGI